MKRLAVFVFIAALAAGCGLQDMTSVADTLPASPGPSLQLLPVGNPWRIEYTVGSYANACNPSSSIPCSFMASMTWSVDEQQDGSGDVNIIQGIGQFMDKKLSQSDMQGLKNLVLSSSFQTLNANYSRGIPGSQIEIIAVNDQNMQSKQVQFDANNTNLPPDLLTISARIQQLVAQTSMQ